MFVCMCMCSRVRERVERKRMGIVGEEKRTKIGKIDERSNLSPCGVRGGGARPRQHAGRRWPIAPIPSASMLGRPNPQHKSLHTKTSSVDEKKPRRKSEHTHLHTHSPTPTRTRTRTLLAKIMQLGVTLLAFAYNSQGYFENSSD